MRKRPLFITLGSLGLLLAAGVCFIPYGELFAPPPADEAAAPQELTKEQKAHKVLDKIIHQIRAGKRPVNKADARGNTPLMLAVRLGDRDKVQCLLLFGADPAQKNAEGKSAAELTTDEALLAQLTEEAPLMTWEEATALLRSLVVKNKSGKDSLPAQDGDGRSIANQLDTWNALSKGENLKEPEDAVYLLKFLACHQKTDKLIGFLLRQHHYTQEELKSAFDSCAYDTFNAFTLTSRKLSVEDRVRRERGIFRHYGVDFGHDEGILLHKVIRGNDIDSLRYLLEQGVPVHRYCRKASKDVWQEDFFHVVERGMSLPLGAAAYFDSSGEFLKLLLRQPGASQQMLDDALACACLSFCNNAEQLERFAKVEKMLLDAGARHSGRSLAAALQRARNAKLIERLNAEVSQKDRKAMTIALHSLITDYNGHLDATYWQPSVRLLIEGGADVHIFERFYGKSSEHPLRSVFDHIRCHQFGWAYLEIYELMVQHGLNEKKAWALPAHKERNEGATLLGTAWDPHQIAYMLERGAAPLRKDDKGLNAFERITREGIRNDNLAERWMLSVAVGSPIKVAQDKKDIAVQAAIAVGAVGVLKKLLQHGGDLRSALSAKHKYECWIENYDSTYKGQAALKPDSYHAAFGSTHPIYYLIRSLDAERSRRMLDFLKKKGVDMKKVVNTTLADHNTGTTLLMAAVDPTKGIPYLTVHGRAACPVEAVQWLLDQGADPFAKDKEGHTALDLATDEKKKALLRAAMEKKGK